MRNGFITVTVYEEKGLKVWKEILVTGSFRREVSPREKPGMK